MTSHTMVRSKGRTGTNGNERGLAMERDIHGTFVGWWVEEGWRRARSEREKGERKIQDHSMGLILDVERAFFASPLQALRTALPLREKTNTWNQIYFLSALGACTALQ